MKGLKKRRRIQIILFTFLALIVATGLIGFAFRDGINYFRSPSEILAEPPQSTEVFRIGGLVEEGTLRRGESETVSFSVTDGGASIPVTFTGVLPDLFGENQGMIGTGSYVDGVFLATDILAKHDEEYMPKEVMDSLKEQGVYQDPNS
ncbi:cytochrome c maturation protein CcmE [Maritimibacter dapengensis]|uniref:Cytochrome c-type biogenesis protein CcmE n=1 Tax=Maritimibacter dapengensis TaxID=2836868 RepID=A0ABS6T247_9RHOB|nr:cytochrome c maturation protein CcmE [Maritimibacter dapengensis]MBV7379287.1 cytochrome c maturation protein CcmE [Maritimibacter dapengensis]